jgi:hypothetical protein
MNPTQMTKMIGNLKFRLFIWLLKWFCDETDQWDCLKIKTKSGTTWYIDISLKPVQNEAGTESTSYRVID